MQQVRCHREGFTVNLVAAGGVKVKLLQHELLLADAQAAAFVKTHAQRMAVVGELQRRWVVVELKRRQDLPGSGRNANGRLASAGFAQGGRGGSAGQQQKG